MQLLHLPPEILVTILNFVGPDHFRKHAGCLAISKAWYRFARPVLLSCIQLSTSTLRSGLLRALRDPGTLAATQRHTTAVTLCLDPPSPDESSDEQHVGHVLDPGSGLTQVATDLVELGSVLCGFTQLRSLRIHPGQDELRLEIHVLAGLVSQLRRLTSLDIDLANVEYMETEIPAHMCTSISALMPSLVSLRCRLPYLCEQILGPPPENGQPVPHSTGRSNEGSLQLPLTELIVNTSISEWSPRVTGYAFTQHCDRLYERLYPIDGPSRSRLQSRMSSLTSQCPNLTLVRLISHQVPSLDWCALDALSGNKLWMPPGSPWDADGEVIDEVDEQDDSNSENDLFNSGSESSSSL
ncbi:hypothetical protein KVR01_013571 [Diaporthe batatas]|uniref:uncharacterized protein n=1 Tax=Diaporthe batatas TaxID=748121 RepID=UPI001D05C114|nr:uncharacterized protein KVR01_013571 [Diaporthe batatas]KAG8156620.1 hypothetical protein KVR01_013571 [Diaporthe batatas]